MMYHLGDSSMGTNCRTFEAMLIIKQSDDTYKKYSTIMHIGKIGNNITDGYTAGDGLFTVYDTTTHKITYVMCKMYGNPPGGVYISDFAAYQDGADITTTFKTNVVCIKLYMV